MTYPISTILDNDLLVSDLLREIGIKTTGELEKRGADIKARNQLATQILDWVTSADLMRVKGIGRTYAGLLHECSVKTARELSYRSASNLTRELQEANERLRLVKMIPPEQFVARWIERAKVLPMKVTYR